MWFIKSSTKERLERLENLVVCLNKDKKLLQTELRWARKRFIDVEAHRNRLLCALQAIFKAFPNGPLEKKYKPLMKEVGRIDEQS